MSLKQFERNGGLTQFGELGVIKEIFKRLEITKGICFDAGAGDGIHLSNTYDLWFNQNWDAVLVESDEAKSLSCVKRVNSRKTVRVLHSTLSLEQGIDHHLLVAGVNKEIDFLSLDVDGNEYHLLDAMKSRPKVMVVEFNPTIPFHLDAVGAYGKPVGSSVTAIERLGVDMGYLLAHCTNTNAFLIQTHLFNNFDLYDKRDLLEHNYLKFVISDYRGRTMTYGDDLYGQNGDLRVSDFDYIGAA